MSVLSMVGGAPVAAGATFVARVDGGGPVRVAVSSDASFAAPVFTASQAVDAQGVAKVSISGLQPSTRYWWRVEDNSVVDSTYTGQLLTAPTAGTAVSFTVGCGGDAGLSPNVPGTGTTHGDNLYSNHPVFDTIRGRALTDNWRAFIHLGDLHYADLGGTIAGTTANYRTAYNDVLLQPLQHQLYHQVPFIYLWDDHDYGPNNSDGTLATKANALTAYGERVPHYPLGGSDGIYQSWQLGRVQFIGSDVRYNRSANSDPDGPSKTMLGSTQKTWLAAQLAAATDAGMKLLVWVMPQQWLGTTDDSWASFATEQAELVALFADLGWAGRMCILSADYHGVAIDSGSGSPGSIPVLQAAAFDATPGAGAGGSYDRGAFDGINQYGTLQVNDLGQALHVTLTGWRGTDSLVSLTFSVPGDPPPPISLAALTRTLRGSHRMMVDARVLRTYQTGEDPDGEQVDILGGDVQMDATAEVQRTLSLTTRGRWFHRAEDSLLSPYGNEVFVRRGVDLGSQTLWVPLGYYRIDAIEQDEAPDGPIRIQGSDRMQSIRDARMLAPRTYRPTTLVSALFTELVGEIYPDAVIVFDDDSGLQTLGRELLVEDDRYAALLEVAQGLGKIMYWDDQGILTIRTIPSADEPVWEVNAGFQGVQITAARHITREKVYNAVVATGESSAGDMPPARGVAVDANPLSPTYFGGRFGQVPRFYSSPFLLTDAQAGNTARELLLQSIGLPYSVDFRAVVNPALRPHDPIRVRYRDGNRELHVMERLTVPLEESASMSGQTREQTLVIVEVVT